MFHEKDYNTRVKEIEAFMATLSANSTQKSILDASYKLSLKDG